MIRHQEQSEVPHFLQPAQQGSDDQLVDSLDGLGLEVRSAHVPRFVWRLDMDEQKVMARKRFDSVAALGGIVGIQIAGGARNLYQFKSSESAKPVHQVDRGNHRSADTEAGFERRQRRRAPLSPEPDRSRLRLAL